jgi:hypothetical protein
MIADEAWDAWIARHPEGCLFHTRRWWRILERAFPNLRDRSRWLETGQRRLALPLYAWRRLGGLSVTLHSSFPFLYGGPVPWPRGLEPEAWLAALSGRGLGVRFQSNPFAPQPPPDPPPRGWQLAWDRTHILELPPDEETYWTGILTTQKRNDIRRLARKGVEVVQRRDPEAVSAVHRLYLARVAAWAQRPGMIYPEAYWRAMVEVGGEAIRLYVVTHEGRIIGTTLVGWWGDKAHYIAGYFDHEARRLRPNVLVQDRIIRDAIRAGLRLYDMLPSAGLRNVEVFKESFGSRPVAFWRLERPNPLQRLARRLRRRG